MSLEVVKKFVEESGNEEVLKAISGIEESQKANLDRIGYLEKEFQGAVSKRERQAQLVKEKLGLDEISDESINSFLSNSSKKGTTEFEAEKQKLEAMIAELQGEKQTIAEKFTNTVNMFGVERQLNELGASKEVNGSKAFNILLEEATSGSYFENGQLLFKANDGTTLRNADGTPMSLSDKYNQLKDSSEFGFLFVEQKPKAGSGVGGSKGGGGQVTSLEGLNHEQRIALFKNDPDLFKQLNKG